MKNSSRIFGSILSLPSLIKLIMVNALCLIGFGAALQAQTPPELPKINLEMSAPDSTGQKQLYLCFHAVAGVNYTLEMANQEDGLAYDSWFQTGALVYGLGVDVRLPIYTFHPPDPTTNVLPHQ